MTFSLSFHAEYRCRQSGACCTAGWEIGVETVLARRLERELRAGRLTVPRGALHEAFLVPRDGVPEDLDGVLATDAAGGCRFFDRDSRACAIHRDLGPDALPAACRHFPRVSLIDPRGVFVTLSHYCPTAANLLFDEVPIEIVESPPAFPASAVYEGLDARDALPPLLRAGVLMDWEAYTCWERLAIAAIDQAESAPAALDAVARAAEHVGSWRVGDEPLVARIARAFDPSPSTESPVWSIDTLLGSAPALDARIRSAVPHSARRPAPCDASPRELRDAAEASLQFDAPLRRYLAAKLFATWLAYQGRGLRTIASSLAAAYAVVLVEAIEACRATSSPLDRELFTTAVRQADLLLVHLADPQALARELDVIVPAN